MEGLTSHAVGKDDAPHGVVQPKAWGGAQDVTLFTQFKTVSIAPYVQTSAWGIGGGASAAGNMGEVAVGLRCLSVCAASKAPCGAEDEAHQSAVDGNGSFVPPHPSRCRQPHAA